MAVNYSKSTGGTITTKDCVLRISNYNIKNIKQVIRKRYVVYIHTNGKVIQTNCSNMTDARAVVAAVHRLIKIHEKKNSTRSRKSTSRKRK